MFTPLTHRHALSLSWLGTHRHDLSLSWLGTRISIKQLSAGVKLYLLPPPFTYYYYLYKVVSSNLDHGEVYSIQQYVKKFVSDLRQVGSFHWVFRFPVPIKLTAMI
jgi:hypothetical protein